MDELIDFIVNDASVDLHSQLVNKGVEDFSTLQIWEDPVIRNRKAIGFYGWVETPGGERQHQACCIEYLNVSLIDKFMENNLELYKSLAAKIKEKMKSFKK